MDRTNTFALLLILCNIYSTNAQTDPIFYIGAVVEYANEHDSTQTPFQNIETNVQRFIKHIGEAKRQNADIVVFPECGLSSTDVTADRVLEYTSIIPDAIDNEIPCNTTNNEVKSWSNAITLISCAAQRHKIYVVINLPERVPIENSQEKNYIYNTNVVFDRQGKVIAKYRKFNLFNEPGFNITKEPELITFDTDFGVTFGTFICFDILFPKPALQLVREKNVTDIVYPAAWFSELPFLTALQTQAGWARANGVNLLAAAYSDPINKGGGSGIYTPTGIQNFSVPFKKETTMLVSKIRKIKMYSDTTTITDNNNVVINIPINRGIAQFNTLTDNFTNYATKLIENGDSEFELCDVKFCCKFAFKSRIQTTSDYYYRAAVYNGKRIYGSPENEKHIQVCAVIACTNQESVESCGLRNSAVQNVAYFDSISIRGSQFDKNNNTVQFPTAVKQRFAPFLYAEYKYCTDSPGCLGETHMNTTREAENLLGFGIYAIVSSAERSFSMVLPFVLMFTLLIHFVWRKL